MAVKTRHNGQRTHYDISGDVDKIKAALFDTTQDLKDYTVDTVKHQSAEMRDSVAGYTAKKPFKALGIALLAGVAIGYLLRR